MYIKDANNNFLYDKSLESSMKERKKILVRQIFRLACSIFLIIFLIYIMWAYSDIFNALNGKTLYYDQTHVNNYLKVDIDSNLVFIILGSIFLLIITDIFVGCEIVRLVKTIKSILTNDEYKEYKLRKHAHELDIKLKQLKREQTEVSKKLDTFEIKKCIKETNINHDQELNMKVDS